MFVFSGNFPYVAVGVSFSIKDFALPYQEFLNLLEEEGLEKFAPRKRTMGEVFETVSRRLQKTYTENGLRYETIVKTVSNTGSGTIERVIQVTEINKEGHKSTHGYKTARLVFNKDTKEFNFITSSLPPTTLFAEEEELIPVPEFILNDLQKIAQDIIDEATFVSNPQIRGTVTRTLSYAGIPSEGIPSDWTIPKTEEGIANALKALSEKINSTIGHKVFFCKVVPIADEEALMKQLSGDAVAFAEKEFTEFLFREQEKIEMADNPDVAYEKAAEKFKKKAEDLAELIKKHENLTQEVFDKIETVKERFDKKLKTFSIKLEKVS